ncbi:MAG: hypothetical protein IPG46_03730 [Actinobacteria bacterium]|nr:hypothetical protein [Actinomycetota bacterium]
MSRRASTLASTAYPTFRPFIPPAELAGLCDAIRHGSRAGIAGLRGEGGTGKSVLAAAAARALADEFPGGVHWVTIGEHATEEDVRRLQAHLLASVGAPFDGQLRDFNEGREQLTIALSSRPALVVIDDAWRPWQAIAFDALSSSSLARILFTTRFPEVLPGQTAALGLESLGAAGNAVSPRRSRSAR